MCPLIVAPNRGYADYQRVGNYDSGVLATLNFGPTNVGSQTQMIDVSRYAYLGGSLQCTLASVQVTILWYADVLGTVQVGERTFAVNANVSNPAQLRLPNLGPFCLVAFTAISGANYTVTGRVFGTNRVHPCELIPLFPQLLTISSRASAINQVDNFWLNGYFSGPMQIWAISGGLNLTYSLFYMAPDGSTPFVWQAPLQTVLTTAFVIAPPGPLLAQIVNNSGSAATYSLSITPSLSGAT